MPAPLTALSGLRSRLSEDLLAYLDALVEDLAALPAYFPAQLRTQAGAASGFEAIRQVVQVIEDRAAFAQWLRAEARVAEQERAAGREIARRAYAPRRARPERAEDSEREKDREAQPPPPPVPWDDAAAARFRQAVILADPGFGKTWLLKHETIRLARQAAEQLRTRRHGVESLVVPIFVRLSELARSDHALAQALTRHVLERASTARKRQAAGQDPVLRPVRRPTAAPGLAAYLASQLARGHCAVHLDAWDEVPPEPVGEGGGIRSLAGTRQRQGERLRAFAEGFTGPLRVTSRLVGYGGQILPGAQELELIAFEPPQIEAFLDIWFADDERRQALLTLLQEEPTLRGLSRIPLMLTLLCRAYEQAGALPERRVDLYEQCLHGLLRDWLALDKQADREDPKLSDPYVEALLDLLAGVAHTLHDQGREQFTAKELAQAIGTELRRLVSSDELHGRTPSSLIQELKRDGVLIALGDENPAYLFLHRTFQEYLAARQLARQANVAPQRYAEIVRDIAERLWWLPEWREVIVLLAGRLDDPLPLLNALAKKRGDDIARRRLALAGLALGEVDPERFGEPALCRQRDRITTDAMRFWQRQWQNGTEALAAYVARSLPTLARRQGCYQGRALTDWIVAGLSGETADHEAVLVLLSQARIVTPSILTVLADLLRDPVYGVRASAAKVVSELGAAAATPPILAVLAEQLREPERGFIDRAAWAVGKLGAAAATPPILAVLAEQLREPERGFIDRAAWAVGKLGAAAATPPILAALAELMRDPKNSVRHSAARAVGELGAAAATPPILAVLAELLRKPERGAVYAVGQLGAAAATPQILAALAELQRNPKWAAKFASTAETVGELGAAAVVPPCFATLTGLLSKLHSSMFCEEFLNSIRSVMSSGQPTVISSSLWALANLLRDSEIEAHHSAVSAVVEFRLPNPTLTPPILVALADLLRHPGKDVRLLAVRAVGELGDPAVTPPILAVLADVLRDPDKEVCASAVEAVGELGDPAATPPILTALAKRLRDRKGWARSRAVEAVGKLGATAATPPILAALAERLRDRKVLVRVYAAVAVSRLGAAAATPQILAALADLPRDPDVRVRESADQAIVALLESGARIPLR